MPFNRGAMAARPARTRPVRLTLFGLLVVPIVSLVALWGVVAANTIGSAVTEHQYNTVTVKISAPTQALSADLSQEQAQSLIWLSTGGRSPMAPLAATRQQTDAVIAADRGALQSIQGEVPAPARPPLDALFTKLRHLGSIRAAVNARAVSPSAAFQAYSNIIDDEFLFFQHAVQVQNANLFAQSIGTIDASRALVMSGREMALVAGALAAGGQMSTAARELFANTVTSQRLLMGDALVLLAPGIRGVYERAYSSPTYHRFAAMENQISASVGRSGVIPVNQGTWVAVSLSFLATMEKAETQNSHFLASLANQLSSRLVTDAALAGGLGLVAIVASIFLMVWFGRRLTGELTGLHTSVQSMAEDRLPSVVERLRSGEEVDVAAESPPPSVGKIAEIAKVAEAFGTVQRTAVGAAVGQANLRKGVNQVFLNLSLRNQSLLHRQLAMLDSMERATSEPAALADLFRLDHLTTRMRRHAEGLIILSGATPGRGWRDPVPVVDVLRAAVAEVEDYVRVDVISESRDAVVGAAVNDVIHLVAELVENATAFSPPSTPVEIKAEGVGNGFAVEIEDRGLGLTAEEMTQVNERLAMPPEFDLANSDQLGLFVVGQLAARHGIKVSLRSSPYGGTRAIVLLPRSIVVQEGESGESAGMDGGQPVTADSSTGQVPALATAVTRRQRAAIFSLTGRHRAGAGALDDEIPSELTYTAAPADPAGPTQAADDSWPEPAWPEAAPQAADRQEPSWPEARPETASPLQAVRPDVTQPEATAQESVWQGDPWQQDSWRQDSWRQVPQRRVPQSGDGELNGSSLTAWPDAGPEATSSAEIQDLASAGPAVADTHLGLPVRVRQASLAPQLRTGPSMDSPTLPAVPVVAAGPGGRSPEQARNLMAALQKGWEHGRTDDLDDPEGSIGDWPIAAPSTDVPAADSPDTRTDSSNGEAQ